MIEQVLRYINNFYLYDKATGQSVELNGFISNDYEIYLPGQYIYVVGTVLNDGVYLIESIDTLTGKLVTDKPLEPESGRRFMIYAMRVPKALQDLVKEIEAYNIKNPEGVKSESLGDYSVTYGGNQITSSWQASFSAKLAPYKKVYLNLPRE